MADKALSARNSGQDEAQEKKLTERFQPPDIGGLKVNPLVITDKDGEILLWYLPDIISKKRAVSVCIQLSNYLIST